MDAIILHPETPRHGFGSAMTLMEATVNTVTMKEKIMIVLSRIEKKSAQVVLYESVGQFWTNYGLYSSSTQDESWIVFKLEATNHASYHYRFQTNHTHYSDIGALDGF